MADPSPRDRLLVRDLMKVGVATCPMDATVAEMCRLFLDQNLEALVVLDVDGHGVGVVSQDDLVRAYSQPDARALTAEKVMREQVPEVPPDIPLHAAAQLMQDMKVRALFLLHHASGIAYPAASLTYRHLIRHLAAQDDEELKDLGVQAPRQTPLNAFIERRDAARRKLKGKP